MYDGTENLLTYSHSHTQTHSHTRTHSTHTPKLLKALGGTRGHSKALAGTCRRSMVLEGTRTSTYSHTFAGIRTHSHSHGLAASTLRHLKTLEST